MTGIELIADLRGAPAADVSEAIQAWAGEPHAVAAFARALFAVDDRALVSGTLPAGWEAVDGVVPGLLDAALADAGRRGHGVLALTAPVYPAVEALGVLVDLLDRDPMFGAAVPRAQCSDGCCVGTIAPLGAAPEWMPQAALAELPEYVLPGDFVSPATLLSPVLLTEFGDGDDLLSSLAGGVWARLLGGRRAGFRQAVSNRSAMRLGGASCQSGSAPALTMPPADADRLQRFENDVQRSWREFRGEATAGFERLTARHVAARRGGRRSVLLDLRNLGGSYNGTAFAALGAARGLRDAGGGWEISLLASEHGAEFHRLSEQFPGWTIHTQLPRGEFNAALRLSQPWHIQEMIDLHRLARLNAYLMLDTICWDVVYVAPPFLDGTWRFLAATADSLLFISDFSRQRFRERFPADRPSDSVCHLSFDPDDYVHQELIGGEVDDCTLVIGNHLEHKDVAATAALLTSAFPLMRVQTLGPTWWRSSRVTAHHSGHLEESAVQALYARARLSVFPSFYEGFGLPIVTALGYGRTLLARDSGLLAEIAPLCAPRGTLIPFRERDELVDKVGALLAGDDVGGLPLGTGLNGKPRGWRDVGLQIAGELDRMLTRASSDGWHAREALVSHVEAYRA